MSTSPVNPKATAKLDRIRAREMFRYFQPDGVAHSGDTTLTALAQLVALKLDCQSVLVNVISNTTQFTLTEGTRTLDIGEAHQPPNAKNGLWVGCGGMDKESAICQHTVNLPLETENSEFLIIPDLREDGRTQAFDYVLHGPQWRFYLGAPLISKTGIPIGALCILDDKVRYTVTPEQKAFCRTMTLVIMEHLEALREVAERKKGMRMSKCLNAFLEGRTTMDIEANEKTDFGTLKRSNYQTAKSSKIVSTTAESESPDQHHNEQSRPDLESANSNQSSGSKSATSDDSLSDRTDTGGDNAAIDDDHDHTDRTLETERTKVFWRAANLLRQSLDLQNHGGVMFVDTSIGFSAFEKDLQDLPTSPDSSEAKTLHTPPSPQRYDRNSRSVNSTFEISRGPGKSERGAQLLSLSHACISETDVSYASSWDFYKPLSEQAVQHLLRLYPKGHLWTFDELAGNISSDSDRPRSLRDKPAKPGEKRESRINETAQLQQAFVGVRQLLFIPQRDTKLDSQTSCCFCWTTSEQQVFSNDMELSYLAAFSNCIMAEMARLSSIHANHQKNDFISSISHELRSPLHGILACAEFLAETTLDPFQSTLVDTINASGRTLHQTIEHVLDYSKINAFERTLRKSKKSRSFKLNNSLGRRGMPLIDFDTPQLNIYAVVDIAAVTEEVVQGTFAASEFDAYASTEMASATASARGRNSNRGLTSGSTSIFTGAVLNEIATRVEVILDIEPAEWTFMTQQGALRRLIMNLLGNSLKYTEKGRIVVKLSLVDNESSQATPGATKVLVLRVIDTGKGISPEYLRTRLFTPFAQENALAPGTGLGLSIVKSITGMLGGSIEVRSQVNKGTEVKVTLPMTPADNNELGSNTPKSTLSGSYSSNSSAGTLQEDSISILRAHVSTESVAIYGFDADSDVKETGRVLVRYLTDWFGFSVIADSPSGPAPTIVLTDETNLAALLARGTSAHNIVVFCTSSSRYHHNNMFDADKSHNIEFCAKPFGPYRLAKILRTCLQLGHQSDVARRDESMQESRDDPASVVPTPEFDSFALKAMSEAPALVEPGTLVAAPTENAHMALGSEGGSSTVTEGPESKGVDFPFPPQNVDALIATKFDEPKLVRRSSMPRPKGSRNGPDAHPAQANTDVSLPSPQESSNGVEMPSSGPTGSRPNARSRGSSNAFALGKTSMPKRKASAASQGGTAKADGAETRQPRILVVDDNKINLLLLQTFMKKRKHVLVDSAENGYLAVKAAERCEEGYDVIFMDISMPIMDGFEATRRIRSLESLRSNDPSTSAIPSDHPMTTTTSIAARLAALTHHPSSPPPFITPCAAPTYTPALIIALTALASQQDQSEAFASGLDLFMTKPVSFKEVGRLLDSWEESFRGEGEAEGE